MQIIYAENTQINALFIDELNYRLI
jgi:hypothetical protein